MPQVNVSDITLNSRHFANFAPMRTLFLLAALLFQSFNLLSQELIWLKTTAPSDATPRDLLNMFGLADYDCNYQQFYRLNKMTEKSRVRDGHVYQLPIQIAKYNGKSIRTTLKINDWQTAKRIEQYNRLAKQRGLRDDDFITTRDLWVPWHELECQRPKPLPPSIPDDITGEKEPDPEPKTDWLSNAERGTGKDGRTFAIFGPQYQHTPLISKKLRGKVFYLISGHAGPDPGARGRRAGNLLCEDEYAYDVTLRLLRLLLSHGATAYMIVRDPNDGIRDQTYLRCDTDEVVWKDKEIPLGQKDRLTQRTDIINDLTIKHLESGRTNQTIIEIHVDSRHDDEKIDVFFYYRPESEPSRQLAERFHQTFKRKYQQTQGGRAYNGSVSDRYLHTLKETTARRAVYVELGNIQNDWDQQRIVLKNNRQALANWMCQALLNE